MKITTFIEYMEGEKSRKDRYKEYRYMVKKMDREIIR